MKKVYINPETLCAPLQSNSIICTSVGGGASQSEACAPGMRMAGGGEVLV